MCDHKRPQLPLKLQARGSADLQGLVNPGNEVNCADRAYNCDLNGTSIVLTGFNVGMLIVFLLAWAISIVLARECTSILC